MRSRCTDFGITTTLRCKFQRSITCAVVLPCAAPILASIDYIDWKQGFYDDALAGRTDYFSNLLPAES